MTLLLTDRSDKRFLTIGLSAKSLNVLVILNLPSQIHCPPFSILLCIPGSLESKAKPFYALPFFWDWPVGETSRKLEGVVVWSQLPLCEATGW